MSRSASQCTSMLTSELVWVANVYMTAFGRLRLDMKYQRVEIAAKQEALGTPIETAVSATTLETPRA